jgi:hypothetical protein
VLLIFMLLTSSTALATRVLVAPVSGDDDATTRETLGHAIERSVAQAMPGSEIVSTTTIENASELAALRDCIGDDVAAACLSEVAGAANAELVVRSHLGHFGDELVLSVSVLDGTSSKVLGQGQRRVERSRAAALLDRTPALVEEALRASGHFEGRPWAVVPVVVTALSGASLTAGVAVWVVFAVRAVPYANAELTAAEAAAFEQDRVPLVASATALTVVGAGGVLVGSWMLAQE